MNFWMRRLEDVRYTVGRWERIWMLGYSTMRLRRGSWLREWVFARNEGGVEGIYEGVGGTLRRLDER